MTESQRIVYECHGPANNKGYAQIATETGLTFDVVRKAMLALVALGRVTHYPQKPGRKVDPVLDRDPTPWSLKREIRSGERCPRCWLHVPCNPDGPGCELNDPYYAGSEKMDNLLNLLRGIKMGYRDDCR